jgi:hypothetical protein
VQLVFSSSLGNGAREARRDIGKEATTARSGF